MTEGPSLRVRSNVMTILLLSAQPTDMCLMTRLSQDSTFVMQGQPLKDLPASPTILTQGVCFSSKCLNEKLSLITISVITALPHYVSKVEGYSPSSLRTYLNDNLGALLSSEVDNY